MTKLYFALLALVTLLAAAFVGYGIYLNRASNSYVSMTLAQRVLAVRGVPVERREIRPEIVIPQLNLETQGMVDVVSKVDGTLYGLQVEIGDRVGEGDLLCGVDNVLIPIFTSRANMDILKAESSYNQAKNMLSRHETLFSKQVITESELEETISRMAAAESELLSARVSHEEMLEQEHNLLVNSPASGNVLAIYYKSSPGWRRRHSPAR